MMSNDYILAQLRHAYHHLNEGRNKAGKEVVASVIRNMERNDNDGK